MSVTFQIQGERIDYEDDSPASRARWVNLGNANAVELLDVLGLDFDREAPYGALSARALRAACVRYLFRPMLVGDGESLEVVIVGAHDAARPVRHPRSNVIECGRAADYLARRVRDLLRLAELAGDGAVAFS